MSDLRYISKVVALTFIAGIVPGLSQTVNVSGMVVDSATLQGISNAKVALVEFPQCSTRTDAAGAFVLGGTVAIRKPAQAVAASFPEAHLRGNLLTIDAGANAGAIAIDVFGVNGTRIGHRAYTMSGFMRTIKSTPSPAWVRLPGVLRRIARLPQSSVR